MTKNEAIKYITSKGMTRRSATKIYNQAVACVDVPTEAIDEAIKNYIDERKDD